MKLKTNSTRHNQLKSKSDRSGFTLVELVIVILIIGILVAFLLPAVNSAIRRARVATVVSEIRNLDKAIGEFKLEYGVEPPSSIVLYEKPGDGSNGTPNWRDDNSRDLLRRQSVAFLKQAFPRFNFDTASYDINGDGDFDDFFILRGAECLVFFLGGVCATEDAAGGQIVSANGQTGNSGVPAKWFPLGFSTNPATPFARGGNRNGPFFEFDSERLLDVSASAERSMPEYLDTIPGQILPYLYVSSDEGRGYNTDIDTDGNIDFYPDLDLGNSSITLPRFIYLQSATYFPQTGAHFPGAVPMNDNSYQIISPGFDYEYGPGGLWSKEDGIREPFVIDGSGQSTNSFINQTQKDNITNFSGGMLDPS